MRVIFSCGGTAGHINPALAIASDLRKRDENHSFLFIGAKEGFEGRLVSQKNFPIEYIMCCGLKRSISIENFKALYQNAIGIFQSYKIIKKFKPDIVIGTGGFVSGPAVLCASLLKIPTIIHEQNVFVGITTRILSKFVDKIMVAFEESERYIKYKEKIIHTGNPLRDGFINEDPKLARKNLGLDEKPFIVCFGGSLGADKINQTMIEFIKNNYAKNTYNILLVTGEHYYRDVAEKLKGFVDKKSIFLKTYVDNMPEIMAASDIVVCRSGALTISEITALGKVSILIPSPNVTDDHQTYNADMLVEKKAAIKIDEKNLDEHILQKEIERMMKDKNLFKLMEQRSKQFGTLDALEKIYDVILKTL